MTASADTPPFDESRRLTGANLYFDGPGAALETAADVAFDADALQRWRDNIARVREALGWPDGAVVVREHDTGASLAYVAPIDRLYTAAEANEWAWYDALGLHAGDEPLEGYDPPRPHVAHFEAEEALRRLRALSDAEAKPGELSLLAEARSRGIPAHVDDDDLSIGEGAASRSWPIAALPAAADVPWSQLRAVPKAVVTGSNGKTTTVRLLAAMFKADGLVSGYSSTDGLMIDGECVDAGDYSGPVGARTVLRDPRVQAAVLETARGGMLRRGLVARDAQVAVVTNVSPDHFGEYGIHNLGHLAQVKLTVARSLGPHGRLVLNADDALLVELGPKTGAPRFGWFAMRLEDALARGAFACGVRYGRLLLSIEGSEHDLGEVAAMPLTVAGSAGYNIANAAAASLSAYVLGIAPDVIAGVLARFGSQSGDNPGRLQRWEVGGIDVLVDYAHNPDGLRGLLHVAEGLRRGGRLGLLLGHAGNRLEDDYRALADVAFESKPDHVWLKDIGGEYLRGRASGDVAAILFDTLRLRGMPADAMTIRLDEAEAAREALAWARQGDLLVLPLHELSHRQAVQSLLDRLKAEGWQAGQPVPARDG